MENLIAQSQQNIGEPITGTGPLGLEGVVDFFMAFLTFNKVISATIGVMTFVAFLWFLVQIFIGAINYIQAGGDKTKVEDARHRITNGLIGLVIVISTFFIISFIGILFGIDIRRGASLLLNF